MIGFFTVPIAPLACTRHATAAMGLILASWMDGFVIFVKSDGALNQHAANCAIWLAVH
jgi:hypothetical protein